MADLPPRRTLLRPPAPPKAPGCSPLAARSATIRPRDRLRAAARARTITVRSINERIGFWVRRRPYASDLVEAVEFEWRCGCNALLAGGAVVQHVRCPDHSLGRDPGRPA